MKTSMKTSICIGLVILVIVGIAGCAESNEQKSEIAQPASEVTPPISEPTTAPGTVIASFTGTETETFAPFTVPTSQWRIIWDFKPSTQYTDTIYGVYLYDSNNSMVDIIADSKVAGNGSTYVYEPAGVYHIKVIAGAAPFNVTVETA
jgi:hypothetical protein